MVGFSSVLEKGSFDVDGALAPMEGMGDVERREGNIHDAASCWKVMMYVEVERSDAVEQSKILGSRRGVGK